MVRFLLPGIVVLFGVAWSLTEFLAWNPRPVFWSVGLLAAGVLVFRLAGWTREAFILGSMLILGSGFSIFRHTGLLTMQQELPLLVVAFGVVWGVALALRFPVPPESPESPAST